MSNNNRLELILVIKNKEANVRHTFSTIRGIEHTQYGKYPYSPLRYFMVEFKELYDAIYSDWPGGSCDIGNISLKREEYMLWGRKSDALSTKR